MTKYYITESQDGWCLSDYDHSKFPTKELPGGYFEGPDAWTESMNPLSKHEPAMLFDTEEEAQEIADKIKSDPFNIDDDSYQFTVHKVAPAITKAVTTNQDFLESVISVLKCSLNRADRYGSFGDDDTVFIREAIEDIIEQLEA